MARRARAEKNREMAETPAIALENAARVDSPTRRNLMEAVFSMLGRGQGCLDVDAMRILADFVGFEGDHHDWWMEYCSLCVLLDCDPDHGLDLKAFVELVEDESDDGCHCSDDELRELAGLLRLPSSSPSAVTSTVSTAVPLAVTSTVSTTVPPAVPSAVTSTGKTRGF